MSPRGHNCWDAVSGWGWNNTAVLCIDSAGTCIRLQDRAPNFGILVMISIKSVCCVLCDLRCRHSVSFFGILYYACSPSFPRLLMAERVAVSLWPFFTLQLRSCNHAVIQETYQMWPWLGCSVHFPRSSIFEHHIINIYYVLHCQLNTPLRLYTRFRVFAELMLVKYYNYKAKRYSVRTIERMNVNNPITEFWTLNLTQAHPWGGKPEPWYLCR